MQHGKENRTYLHFKHFFTRNSNLSPITKWFLRLLNWIAKINPLQWRSKRVKNLKYINIGCGKNPKSHTINLNFEWYPFIDLTWDVTKSLPIPDASMKGVYSEHVIEHLPFDTIPKIFADWKRILEPRGRLRIVVPDAELYLRIYIGDGGKIFPYHNEGWTPMMHVNQVFRGYEHLYAWDFETLKKQLEMSGFSNIQRVNYNQGTDPLLLIDSDDRKCESLYVECEKI